VLSIGVFFTIITLGLAASLPGHLSSGLIAQGDPRSAAQKVAALPPICSLFSAFLGFNPIQELLGNQHTLVHSLHLTPGKAQYLLGRSFFPKLISASFASGLHLAFDFAAGASFIAAIASILRGGRYIHAATPATGAAAGDAPVTEEVGAGLAGAGDAAASAAGAGQVVDEEPLEDPHLARSED
jgi:hypothetical protein